MKSVIFLIFCVFKVGISMHCAAQTNKAGNTWVVGPMVGSFTFKGDTSAPSFRYRKTVTPFAYFADIASCVSDSNNGNLLFFSNAITVWDSNGNEMQNGTGLMGGLAASLAWRQNSIILPKANNQYYLFYTQLTDDEIEYADSTGDSVYYAKELRYSIVDMNANGGLGAVTQKNLLVTDTGRMRTSGMYAIRHANGKDWWLMNLGFGRDRKIHNYVFRTLVTADSVYAQQEQFMSTDSVDKFHIGGRMMFNPQGTKISYVTADRGGFIADFNRCNGLLSNLKRIPNIADYANGVSSVMWATAWSPNGRFLYVTGDWQVVQFDTWSTDSLMNKYVVCYLDTNAGQVISTYSSIVLAPDGKLYVGNLGAPSKYVQRIDQPDSPGAACHLKLRWFTAPDTFINGSTTQKWGVVCEMPNIADFNLPAEPGYDAKCWPLSFTDALIKKQLLLYPNPARNYIDVQLQGAEGVHSFSISNVHGSAVLRGSLLASELTRVQLGGLASGLYVLRCGGVCSRFVVE
jgi:hypothetical protein